MRRPRVNIGRKGFQFTLEEFRKIDYLWKSLGGKPGESVPSGPDSPGYPLNCQHLKPALRTLAHETLHVLHVIKCLSHKGLQLSGLRLSGNLHPFKICQRFLYN